MSNRYLKTIPNADPLTGIRGLRIAPSSGDISA